MIKFLKNILLIFISFGSFLFVGEGACRIFGYAGDHERKITNFDTDYGQLDKDSWVLNFEIDEQITEFVKINSKSVAVKKPTNEYRILFVGDSGTAGAGVGILNSFPEQFLILWQQAFPEKLINVINSGVNGMTTIDEYHFLKDQLVKLDPDVVVVGLFMANDINFNLAQSLKSLKSGAGSLVHKIAIFSRQHSAFAHYLSLRVMVINSKYNLITKVGLQSSGVVPEELRLIDEHGFNMVNYMEGEAATYFKEYSPMMHQTIDHLEKAFASFKQLSIQKDFKLVILLLPTTSTITGQLNMLCFPHALDKIKEKTKLDLTQDDFDVDKPTRMVMDICERLDILCVNPTAEFKKTGIQTILPKNDHPSVLGHRILAIELLKNKDLFLK